MVEVTETLQFIKVIYDYAYLNSVFKERHRRGRRLAEPLRFLTVEPVAYLDSIQAEYVDGIMENLKAELGVESTRVKPPDKPFSQLYTINKLFVLSSSTGVTSCQHRRRARHRARGERQGAVDTELSLCPLG